MTKPFAWDDAAIKLLQDMVAQNMTAAQIAVAIGVGSRSAVLGKLHRLRTEGRPKVSRPVAPKPPKAPKPEREPRAEKPRGILPAGGLPKDPEARRDVFCAIADKANERFAETVAAVTGTDAPGIRFLDRGLYQCAMPLPGWDDAPITEKRVCGRPVRFRPCDFGTEPTSYCPACSKVILAPAGFKAFKERSLGVSA